MKTFVICSFYVIERDLITLCPARYLPLNLTFYRLSRSDAHNVFLVEHEDDYNIAKLIGLEIRIEELTKADLVEIISRRIDVEHEIFSIDRNEWLLHSKRIKINKLCEV